MIKTITHTETERFIPEDDVRDFLEWIVSVMDKGSKAESKGYLQVAASKQFWNDFEEQIEQVLREE